MKITLELTSNIYGPPNGQGRQKCIKRDIRYKKTFDSHSIDISNYITSKGVVSKTLSIVVDKDKEYIVRMKFEELERLIKPVIVIGYKKWK